VVEINTQRCQNEILGYSFFFFNKIYLFREREHRSKRGEGQREKERETPADSLLS